MRGLGLLPGRAVRLDRRARAAHRAGPRSATDGAFYFAHSYAAVDAARDGLVGGRRRRGARTVRSSAASSIRRRAARRVRATSRACSRRRDPSPSPDSVPRRGRRPRRQGRPLPRAARRRRPGRARRGYSDAGADELVFLDVKATLERAPDARRARSTRRRAARDPVHGRRRCALVRGRRDAARRGRRQGRGQLGGARAARARDRARRPARLAGGRGRDRRGRRPRPLARRHEQTGRDAVDWAREAQDRGAGEILLTSIDADGTRAGYDLELTAAVADAVDVPVIASGGAGHRAARRRGARRRAGRAARVDPARGSDRLRRCARSCARSESPSDAERAHPGDRAGRSDRARADARVDGRGGRAPHPRDGRGVVLEPLARAALAQGRDVGQHARGRRVARRLRRRRAAPARDAGRARPVTRAASRASRRSSGARSPSALPPGRTGRTRPSCSRRASAPARARWARKRSS